VARRMPPTGVPVAAGWFPDSSSDDRGLPSASSGPAPAEHPPGPPGPPLPLGLRGWPGAVIRLNRACSGALTFVSRVW
jgi:hypothetical protein